MVKRALVAVLAIGGASSGCGPFIAVPMVQRLQPEEQVTVEGMWNNMLTPADRLDRRLLLDTVVAYQLFQLGIDRMTMRAEKDFLGGRVVMSLDFDRAKPGADALLIDVYDRSGRRVRSEEYAGAEVLESTEVTLTQAMLKANSATQPVDEAEAIALRQRIADERAARIQAATQPAR